MLFARRPPVQVGFGTRIIVASDALKHSDTLVDFAIELASEREATLTLVYAAVNNSAERATRISSQIVRVTQTLGDQASVRIEPARPVELIVRTAAADRCSLLIVGSRRVGGVRALGSVSERVVHAAPCSVLVLRPEDRAIPRSCGCV